MFNTKKGENEEGQLDVCFVVVHFCNIYVSYTLFSYVLFKNVLFANTCFFVHIFIWHFKLDFYTFDVLIFQKFYLSSIQIYWSVFDISKYKFWLHSLKAHSLINLQHLLWLYTNYWNFIILNKLEWWSNFLLHQIEQWKLRKIVTWYNIIKVTRKKVYIKEWGFQ